MRDWIIASTNADYQHAAMLFKEYAAWLKIDLEFQSFEKELTILSQMYGKRGGIILVKEQEQYIACVAIREISKEVAELKRMYVQPDFQRQGLGERLLDKALALAKKNGYKLVRLDTLDNMNPAINLYRKKGFYKIEPYYFNPEKNAVFFELKL